jgi:tetratricopeptide (TPR) repeat protein
LALMALLFVCSAAAVRAVVRTPEVSLALRDGIHAGSERVLGLADRLQARRAALLAQKNQTPGAEKPVAQAALLPAARAADSPVTEPPTEAAADASEALADAAASAEASGTGAAAAVEGDDVTSVLAEAKALGDKGRELRALELLRRAARQHKDSPALLESLIKALQKNRSWGEALRFARRRVELDGSSDARLDLARLERATGHRERALALLTPLADDANAGTQARELLRTLTGSESVALRD